MGIIGDLGRLGIAGLYDVLDNASNGLIQLDMNRTPLDNSKDIFRALKKHAEVDITYTKLDGSERKIRATTNMKKIPEKDRPKGVDLGRIITRAENGQVIVYDLDKKDWRTVNTDTAIITDTKN